MMEKIVKVLLRIALFAVGGALIGLLMNALSIIFCPIYFDICIDPIFPAAGPWLDALLIGMRDGALVGFIIALLILCFFRALHWRQWRIIAISSIGGYFTGGIIGVLYAFFAPEYFQETFLAVPHEMDLLLQYAWAGGSIPGMLFGAWSSTYISIGLELEHQHAAPLPLPLRSRRVYAWLWIFGGAFGLHWLYLGRWIFACIQIMLLFLVLCGGYYVAPYSLLLILLLLPYAIFPQMDAWKRKMSKISDGYNIQLAVVIIVFLAGILSPSVPSRSRPKTREISCQSNLRQIYNFIEMYRDVNNCYPKRLDSLSLEDKHIKHCPETSKESYHFFTGTHNVKHAFPLLYDNLNASHPHGTLVLWSDGSITSHLGKHYRGSFFSERELLDAIHKKRQ